LQSFCKKAERRFLTHQSLKIEHGGWVGALRKPGIGSFEVLGVATQPAALCNSVGYASRTFFESRKLLALNEVRDAYLPG
jgi:hypothetical protein